MVTKMNGIVVGALFTVFVSMLLAVPLYARPSFGPNCLSCHTNGGITLTSNATTINVPASDKFGVEIGAEGDTEKLTAIWSSVSDNPSFAFVPSSVVDNEAGDTNAEAKKVRGIFMVTAPSTDGTYTIQVFAAGSGAKGATMTLQIVVQTEGPSTGNLVPRASFLHSRLGMAIEFEDRSWDVDGNITSWQWNFGDNTTSAQQSPIHTYAQMGTFMVTLTVTDDKGSNNTRSQEFMVPSKQELYQLWILQVFYGSLMILFTSVFAIGIAATRKRRDENSSISREQRKVEE